MDCGILQETKFRKSGGCDITRREGIFYRDFRMKRVLEKFPDEESDEREPLMLPFHHSDLCMTPPENLGLLVTPQTPLVPEGDVCRSPRPCSDSATVLVNNGAQCASGDCARCGCVRWGSEKLEWRGGEGNNCASLPSQDLINLFTPEPLSTAAARLHRLQTDMGSPEANVAMETRFEQTSQSNESAEDTFEPLVLDYYDTPSTRILDPHLGQQSIQRPATPDPRHFKAEIVPAPHIPFVSLEQQLSPPQPSGCRRKLQRSASAPVWPCEATSGSLNLEPSASYQCWRLVEAADSVACVPTQPPPLVPTPTNGPSSKLSSKRKNRFDIERFENT